MLRIAYLFYFQTVCALAVAELTLQFEHRDLHWGNILINKCDRSKKITYFLHGSKIEIPSHGVEVTIIDFTLSRITCDGVCIYNDLAQDEDIFKAEGDYQFEIYRLMRKHNRYINYFILLFMLFYLFITSFVQYWTGRFVFRCKAHLHVAFFRIVSSKVSYR